jgi:hydrogenase maturation protease
MITVIGIGNIYRRDDGVGPAVVERLRARHLPGVRLAECDGETTRLLELWDGAGVAVIVDAVRLAGLGLPGRIHRRSLHHPAGSGGRVATAHAADLGDAVELAAVLGRLPRLLLLYGVEVADTSFGLGLSAPVAAAADHVADEIARDLAGRAGPTVPRTRDLRPAHGAAGISRL